MIFYDISPIDWFDIKEEFTHIGVSEKAFDIMIPKNRFVRLYIKSMNYRAANILKQEALSKSCELAVSYETYSMNPDKTDALLSGNVYSLKKVTEKLLYQPFELKKLGENITSYLDLIAPENVSGKYMEIGNRKFFWLREKYIMGIVNSTPDSFYKDSRVNAAGGDFLEKIGKMVSSGASIIDIGGESTRPGSDSVSESEEMDRVIPLIRMIKKEFDIPVSIDTTKASVAEEAFKQGADLLNDISACSFDPEMVPLLVKTGKPVCIMHIQGKPRDMQFNPSYHNLMDEIYEYFAEKIEYLVSQGIKKENIMIDPGIGFGKRIEDNYRLIRYLSVFKTLGLPIMFAGSRKSFIGKLLNKEAGGRLSGSLSAHLLSALNGASFLRVHDVEEQNDVLRIYKEMMRYSRFES